MALTFESVDEILWCYHSNETSSAVLSQRNIYVVCSSNFSSLWMKPYGVTIQVKSYYKTIYMKFLRARFTPKLKHV